MVIEEKSDDPSADQPVGQESENEEARAHGKTPVPGNSSMPRVNTPKKAKKRPAGKPVKGRPKKKEKKPLTFSDSEPSEVNGADSLFLLKCSGKILHTDSHTNFHAI